MTKKTWLITGATSIIAQQFAKIAAQSGCDLILSGRAQAELIIIANDLKLRHPSIQCAIEVMDFRNDCSTQLEKIVHDNRNLSLFIGHSLLIENNALTAENIRELITTNIITTTQLMHAYFAHDQAEHELIFISSVAACRGRHKNSLYGASKNAIEVYLEGLQQKARPTQHITIARLGFIDTVQTYGLPGIFYASPPEACAKACWQANLKRKQRIYHPFFWRYIMLIIQQIPFFIYRKLDI